MRILASILALIWCSGMGAAYAQEPDVHMDGPTRNAEKGVDVYSIESPYLGKPSTIEVLQPDQFEEGGQYRTLYVLPVEGGIGGTYGDGLAEIRKHNLHNTYNLICVTMSFDTVPWYGQHATDKTIRHAPFIREVVVPLIESRYPTTGKPGDRLLLGFSKSGWGAVSMLLRHPDFFGAAAAWDAPLMMTEKEMAWGSRRHYGEPDHMAPYVPTMLIEEKASVLTQEPARLAIFGHDVFGPHGRKFHDLLDALKVPHHFDNSLKFKHHWNSGWVKPAVDAFMQHAANKADDKK